MQAQMPYTVLRDRVLTHPTMTEGLNLLFSCDATEPITLQWFIQI
ncbi:hypothetical protein [Nostoc sp. NMS8]|nr:hypothetical protein [Nostoc sp. NMS8]